MSSVVDKNKRPVTLTGRQKDILYNNAKRLRAELQDTMCTRRECENPTDHNVRKMAYGEMANAHKTKLYRQSMEAIGADPKDCSTERLRRI